MKEIKAERNGEFEEQRKQDIIKKGKYVQINIIVDIEDIENPYTNIKMNYANAFSIASLYKTLQATQLFLKKKFPEAIEYADKNLLATGKDTVI